MKKWIAVLLVAMMAVGMAACGTVNDSPVAILWSDDGAVHVPSDMVNAMERAMYIQNVKYEHYGANGDQSVQTKQAQTALNAGCAALMVELVDSNAAQEIVDAAKAKNVPVVFFNCNVETTVLNSYEKCVLVATDKETLATKYADMVIEAIVVEKKEFWLFGQSTFVWNEDLDRNEDGKITYIGENVEDMVERINKVLTEKDLPALEKASNTDLTAAELILTATDTEAKDVLFDLQKAGYNADRLKTHCIAVFTAEDTVDYKALVMENMPVPPYSLDTENKEEKKEMDKWWNSEEVEAWKQTTKNLCDVSILEWNDLNEYLYTTSSVIGAGRLAGTAIEDYDTVTISAATAVKNLLQGKAATEGIENAEGRKVNVPYTSYVG